jgi:hypothetical protein
MTPKKISVWSSDNPPAVLLQLFKGGCGAHRDQWIELSADEAADLVHDLNNQIAIIQAKERFRAVHRARPKKRVDAALPKSATQKPKRRRG